MSEGSDEVQGWTARRKVAVVLDMITGNTAAAETARSHDLTVAAIEGWGADILTQGPEALRAKPRDLEARHPAGKKELLARIGELTMGNELWEIARTRRFQSIEHARHALRAWINHHNSGRPRPTLDSKTLQQLNLVQCKAASIRINNYRLRVIARCG